MDISGSFHRRKKLIIAAAIVVLLYTMVGFFLIPAVVGSLLPEKLGQALSREVVLGKVRFNPYTLSLTLENMRIADRDGGILGSFERFFANLQFSSLLQRAAVFREVRLDGLQVNLVRTGERQFNFSDLIPAERQAEQPGPDAGSGPRFAVGVLAMTGAQVAFEDRFVDSRHRVRVSELQVTELSSLPAGTGKTAALKMQAAFDGAALTVAATAQPFSASMNAAATVTLENLQLTRYLPYLPVKPAAEIESALLSLTLESVFEQPENASAALSLSGPVRLSDIRVVDGQRRQMLRVPQLSALLGKSAVLSPELIVDEIQVTEPEVLVVREKGAGRVNLLDLVPEPAAAAEPGGPGGGQPGFALSVKRFAVSSGSVRFEDEAVDGGFETSLSEIAFFLENFSLTPQSLSDVRLSFSTDAQESVNLEGKVSLEPVQAEAAFEVRDIDLARYLPYAADFVDFQIQDGKLTLGGRLAFAAGDPAPDVELEQGEAALRSLVLYSPQDQEQIVSIPSLEITGVRFSTADRSLAVGELRSENGELFVFRRRDGGINLAELVAVLQPAEDTEAPSELAEPMQLALERVRIEGYRVRLEDRVPTETVGAAMRDVRVSADGLSNRSGASGRVAFGLTGPNGGTIDLNGDLELNPLKADLKIALDRADIRAFQPYFTDQVKIIVTAGTASTDGRLRLDAGVPDLPKIRYTGKAEINGFQSVDQENALDFVNWESFYLSDVDFDAFPVRLAIEEIGLTGLYSRFIIDEDGTTNLADAFSGREPAAEAAAEEAGKAKEAPLRAASSNEPATRPEAGATAAPSIEIRMVTMQNGHVNFSDRFNPFNFTADLTEIGGRVSGLSSLETERADVLLEGSWENRAPMEIKGKINPLADQRFADLTLTIRDIDLSPFSPYSGKFLGYKLQKGLLTLQLGYLLEGNQLKGDNRAYFEELTLGEPVDSEDATSLPVALAISLLKDPSGTITLDVPVEGDLDDPQFSLGRTILRVLGNLVVKIISAPFAFLGNLAGAQEELSFIDFEPGSTALTPKAEEKIDALITALAERPNLKLEIQGDADPEADPEAMRRRRFDDLIRAQKLKATTGRGETAVPLDRIEISEEEYLTYLERAYDAADFSKPRDADGRIKRLPPEEMEKLLLTQFIFSENDLRQLAVERADTVKSRMLASGQIASDRLFIVEPQIRTAKESDAEGGKSQVHFTIR